MLATVVFVLYADYDWLVRTVAISMQKKGIEEKIRHTVFPLHRFILLQRFSWVLLILSFIFFGVALHYRQTILQYCGFIYRSVIEPVQAFANVFRNNTRQQNISLFILFIVVAVFYSHCLFSSYLTYDEMWSYNYYTANPFYYSFFTYSNYPLFELSTHLFKGFPFPMYVNLRLSAVLFGFGSFFLLYACVRNYFGTHFIAMAAASSFAFMPLSVHYLANGRGVMHELFFAIAGLFSFLYWMANTNRRQWLVLYSIAAVLGLYSMTPHILFIFLLLVIGTYSLLKKDKAAAWLFIKINTASVIIFLILYAPILLTTGSNVYSDVVTGSASFYETLRNGPSVLGYVAVDFVGFNFISLSLYALSITALLVLKKRLPVKFSLLATIVLCLPLSLIFFYLLTRFIYAGRSLAFGALSVPLFLSLFLQLAVSRIDKYRKLANAAGAVIVSMIVLLEIYFYYPVWPLDKYTKTASDLFIDYGISSCYDSSKETSGFFNYYPAIEYHYRLQHKPFDLAVATPNSIRYKTLSANDQYECIVYDIDFTDSTRAPFYHEIYRDPFGKFKIWARKDLKK